MNLLRVPRADAAIASVVTAATTMPVLVPHVQPWWVVALALTASVPVLWRRTLLVPAGLVTGLSMTAFALVQGQLAHKPFLLVPYGPLVCTYTFAALAPTVLRRIGVGLLTAGVLLSLILPHENFETFRSVVTAYVAAYALGVGARARRAQRAVTEERALRLREERAAAVAEERTRIARDMHDIVTHSVGLMVVQAEAGPLVVRGDPAKAEAAFEAIAETGRDAVGQLRLILGALRGTLAREPQPGLDTLADLVERTRHAGLDVVVEERGTRLPVSTAADIAAYRIVQECLTNVLRHAAVRTARLCLTWSRSTLTVEVADGGGGDADFREGHGIVGMRERAGACGGSLTVDPRGFTVTATLPIG
ncbi:sensor histidine kinase [Streptosporangium carneum]|uniref:histidine kinase n=1 Tax=Streptosporangium carneum TaxID=47481 RepID=A0A9W6HXL2_9ACTN|nr:histidine kinase [Streptosporangium carneum]GLK07514.1 two-component sensor histidine kinase [Streptosporangium carneum]